MNNELIINGITYRRVEEPKEEKRLVRWVFNDISSPIKFSEGCTKLIEIRDNERILSRDNFIAISSKYFDECWVDDFLKEMGFD
jgi:hypothetical protein